MTGSSEHQHAESEIREQYDEYHVGESRIGIITDPENEYAWIWSDLVTSVTQ